MRVCVSQIIPLTEILTSEITMLRPKLNRVWASSNANLRRDPGDAKYLQGWISEIPTFQVLNFLQNKIDNTFLALAERGFFEWGSDVTYQLGSVVWNEADKKIYVATVASPSKTLSPDANPAHWAGSSVQITRASYDALSTAINNHIAIVSGNPHGITAGMLNAYTKSEIDAIVATYQAIVAAHANDKSNPHQVTAAQVGAVPITGGTYTGDVIFNGGLFFDTAKTMEVTKTGGLLLRNGEGVVGLDTNGVAIAGTRSSSSPIIREDTFPAIKATNQPDYAAPLPVISLPFVNDINVQFGNITTQSSSWFEPVFNGIGGMYLSATKGTAGDIIASASPLEGAAFATFAADIYFEEQLKGDNSAPWSLSFGAYTTGIKLILYVNGTVLGHVSNQWSGTFMAPRGQWCRAVVRMTPNSVALFYNGVLVYSQSRVNVPITGNDNIIQSTSDPASNKCKVLIRNMRAWPQALTDKQISTL